MFNSTQQPVEKSTTVRHTHRFTEKHTLPLGEMMVLQIYLHLTLPGSVDRERRSMRNVKINSNIQTFFFSNTTQTFKLNNMCKAEHQTDQKILQDVERVLSENTTWTSQVVLTGSGWDTHSAFQSWEEKQKTCKSSVSTSITLYRKRLQFCKKWICPLIRWAHVQWSKIARNNSENEWFQSDRNRTPLPLKHETCTSSCLLFGFLPQHLTAFKSGSSFSSPWRGCPIMICYFLIQTNQMCEVWRRETLSENPQVTSPLTVTLSLF